MIAPSPFDSEIFGIRVAWADDPCEVTPNLASQFDLIYLRQSGVPVLHPAVSVFDVRYDMEWMGEAKNVVVKKGFYIGEGEDEVYHRFIDRLCRDGVFSGASRYYADSRLMAKAGEVYARWAQNKAFCRTFTVAIRSACVGGFLAYSETSEELRISLVAVASLYRGSGGGAELVKHFLRLPGPAKRRVKVEVGNLPAVNLYLSLGFCPVSVETVQHVWLTSSSSSAAPASSGRTSSG